MTDLEIIEVYSAATAAIAHLLRIVLEEAGIQARVVGDILQTGVAESPLSQPMTPRVWVTSQDERAARRIIALWEELNGAPADDCEPPLWICSRCGEEVDGDFEICWNCQEPREETMSDEPER